MEILKTANQGVKTKKIVIQGVDPQHHKQLKSKLALLGISVSEWVRRQIKAFVGGEA